MPDQARMGVQCMDKLSTICANNLMYMNLSIRYYLLGGTHCYGDIQTQSNYSGVIRLLFILPTTSYAVDANLQCHRVDTFYRGLLTLWHTLKFTI